MYIHSKIIMTTLELSYVLHGRKRNKQVKKKEKLTAQPLEREANPERTELKTSSGVTDDPKPKMPSFSLGFLTSPSSMFSLSIIFSKF